MVGRVGQLDGPAATRRTGKPRGSIFRFCSPSPQVEPMRRTRWTRSSDHSDLGEILDKADLEAMRSPRSSAASSVSLELPIRQHGSHDGHLSFEPGRAQATAKRACTDDTITVSFTRLRRPVLRRVSRARDHAQARRRSQRLRRQGTFRRQARHQARPRARRSRPRRASCSATPRSTARLAARLIFAASPASASPFATAARSRSSRARAITAAST